MRTVIVGDIGGHPQVLEEILENLNVDSNYKLPAGVDVIQVGDLVRVYPTFRQRNTRVMEISHKVLRANPAHWIQLAGNHECGALDGPVCGNWNARDSFDKKCLDILTELWESARFLLAAPLRVDGQPVLVTHAGLTVDRWKELGSPDLLGTVEVLNRDVAKPFASFSQPGVLVTKQVRTDADQLWAGINLELVKPWLAAPYVPYSQIHGHAVSYDWPADKWLFSSSAEIQNRTWVDKKLRQTKTIIDDQQHYLYSCDWTLQDNVPTPLPKLLEVENELVGG